MLSGAVSGLARLPGIERLPMRSLTPKFKAPAPPHRPSNIDPQTVLPPLVKPFYSRWEVWLHGVLNRYSPYWYPQVPAGFGSKTTADWYHPYAKIALYLDGSVHEFRNLEEKDSRVRWVWAMRGVRVVGWLFHSVREMQRDVPERYRVELGVYG